MSSRPRTPTHGFTQLGQPVHARTLDHLPTHNWYARLNKKVALFIADKVMTMTAFWLFNLLSLCSLPAILSQFSALHTAFPHWMVSASLIALIAWISSYWLQLIFLPALGVGQNIQNEAADARAAKTFEDVEDARQKLQRTLDLLDFHTEGGVKVILDAIDELKQSLPH